MEKQSKLTSCKHCGAEIATGAKVCPKCGGKNKKPIYKRPWLIAFLVILVLGVIVSTGGDGETSNTADITQNTTEKVTYTAYDVSELMDDLDLNAMKASDKYKNQYVELTGSLSVIDSSGKYISIISTNNPFAITGVQCYIKTNEQKAAVMDMSIGDVITVKGKITDVGELLGYSLNLDEIYK